MRACEALLGGSASASVEDVSVLAAYLDELARRPSLPEEARQLLLAARDGLLGRRIRNHRRRGGSCKAKCGGCCPARPHVTVVDVR